MFAKDYRKAAWGKLSNNWTTAVVAYLIYAALTAAVSSTGVGTIAVLIFDGVLLVGLSSMLLDISRIGQSKIENVFDGFRYGLATNIVAGLLVNIFTFLWTLLAIVAGGVLIFLSVLLLPEEAAVIVSVILYLAMLIFIVAFTLRYALTPYIVV